MARDSKTVAAELMDLVARSLQNPEQCKNLLAVRLEVIYDYAYALGYSTGKKFTKSFAYDLGFADGFRKATEALENVKSAPIALPAGDQDPQPATKPDSTSTPSSSRATRALYHLPCEVCGALYSEDECPVCKARGHIASA